MYNGKYEIKVLIARMRCYADSPHYGRRGPRRVREYVNAQVSYYQHCVSTYHPGFQPPLLPRRRGMGDTLAFWGIPSLFGEMPSPLLKPPSPFIISLISFFIIPYINLYH